MNQLTNLVAGGTGFLGSHLIDSLISNNQKVICLDNNSTGNLRNLKKWEGDNRFKFIEHDIVNPIDIKVDKIWNLACPASPKNYQLNPIHTAKTCFLGTLNLLELANKLNIRILHASTSEIYGDPQITPQSESYWGLVNPVGVRSCYDEGKRIAETLCTDFKRIYNTDIRLIRIFNTFGPRMDQDDGRVISNFICQALRNNPLTVYGDGSQTRSFCYVDDLIIGMIKLMESNYYLPINIGNPNEFSIKQLGYLVKDLINPNLEFEFKKIPQDDPKQRKPSIQLAKEILKWEPRTDLKEGLIKTINWFKENY